VSIAVKGPASVVYVDSYLTDATRNGGRLKRAFPPPLEPDKVTNADKVLLTYDHSNHTDPKTILAIASAFPGARSVVPFTSRDTLVEAGLAPDRIEIPMPGNPLEAAGGTVTAVPSAQTELERDPKRGSLTSAMSSSGTASPFTTRVTR
jgi:L-ascorbate metabolism protein UlaG (beta-lactamase superfamily)